MQKRGILIILLAGCIMYSIPSHAFDPSHPEKVLRDSLPDAWLYHENLIQEMPQDDKWWTLFNDPTLNSLIDEGVDRNFNVLMAMRRINIAKQSLNRVYSGYYPTLDLQAGWQKLRNSGALTGENGPATTMDYFSLGINMSWEIDVFGKINAKAKQAKAGYNATRAEYAAVMTSLCANIARTYITLRTYQAQWEVATEHIASQEKIVKITEARKDAGLASMLDVAQAKVVFNSTKATMPILEGSIKSTINALAILVGSYPENIEGLLSKTAPLPEYHHLVPVGIPLELLRRRPDIVEAEFQLAADAAAVGIAKKDFLPTLSLNGSIGTSAHSIDDLFSKHSFTYSIAPTLSWNIFDGMARKYNLTAAREQMEMEIENYNLVVMTAVEEVENALIAYNSRLKAINVINEVIEQSRRSLSLSVDQYKQGISPFNNVVTAQLDLLQYQNTLVQSQGEALTSLVQLYQALGGGWSIEDL